MSLPLGPDFGAYIRPGWSLGTMDHVFKAELFWAVHDSRF
jgi:hypothetical protein